MELKVRTMADMLASGEEAEILFWVGCAGSFDERAQKISRALAKILNAAEIKFAILGTEEACTGDPAKRAGNEFMFQMLAAQNIATLNSYGVKKIVTACPHCFNTLKNEYPSLGGTYEVLHHTKLINSLLNDGKIKVDAKVYKDKTITYHDSCYLGRANEIYDEPRNILNQLDSNLVEMSRNKEKGLCCGAGGAQMFKEAEKGNREVFLERTDDVLEVAPSVVSTACPFCMTMLRDGVKHHNKEEEIQVLDIAEIVASALI